jgi:oxygen-independent coproporphyrinogen-3 oxidase
MNWAEITGWDHYEISNLCLPGHPSRHNSNYWSGKAYIGFGPSAHSFDGNRTRWNSIANNARYIDAWVNGKGEPYETEVLTKDQQLNEKIMTGLRKKTGIAVDEKDWAIEGMPVSVASFDPWQNQVKMYVDEGWCRWENGRLTLTRKGRLYADHIAAGLFV